MRFVACIAFLLVTTATLSASPVPDSSSATGLWKVEGDVRGQPVNMMCQLTEADRKLNGTCSSATDGYVAHKIAGTVKAQKIQFYFQTSIGGGSITLIVSGSLNQDKSKIDGDLDVEPMAVGGTFAAVREPSSGAAPPDAEGPQVPALATPPAPAVDGPVTPGQTIVTGTWKIDGDVQGTPVKLTCVLTQTEEKLAGTCIGAEEDETERTLTGDATAKGVTWHFNAEYQGQPITVSLTATLNADGNKLTGTIAVAPFDAGGAFVGVKR